MDLAPHQRETMSGEPTLKQRYETVRGRIADAATRSGRRPENIVLTAVTKYASIDQIRELIELGHMDFAENRVQALVQRVGQIDEFLQRHRQLHSARHVNLPEKLRWHMIGHLQRNKVRKVLELVRLIHSVDSLRLAEEIQVATARREEPVEVLVQVNVSGEKSKYGVAPAAASHLVERVDGRHPNPGSRGRSLRHHVDGDDQRLRGGHRVRGERRSRGIGDLRTAGQSRSGRRPGRVRSAES